MIQCDSAIALRHFPSNGIADLPPSAQIGHRQGWYYWAAGGGRDGPGR
ncbi:MAG: hypothetical protein JOY54_00360 [Acidobacteriaceae bacterium]|nr:hypothetical protein [Acidobacteriaceae bacterium]